MKTEDKSHSFCLWNYFEQEGGTEQDRERGRWRERDMWQEYPDRKVAYATHSKPSMLQPSPSMNTNCVASKLSCLEGSMDDQLYLLSIPIVCSYNWRCTRSLTSIVSLWKCTFLLDVALSEGWNLFDTNSSGLIGLHWPYRLWRKSKINISWGIMTKAYKVELDGSISKWEYPLRKESLANYSIITNMFISRQQGLCWSK